MLRRLRQRLRGTPATHNQAYTARHHITAAIAFLDWLAARGLTLATCAQGDLDAWMVTASTARKGTTGHFVRWARSRKHTSVDFPATRWNGPARTLDTEARWDQARQLLHDKDLDPGDRFAGLRLPEPLDELARQLIATRRGHATIGDHGTSPWLPPGGRPGLSISAYRIAERLHQIGIQSGPARSTALFQLAAEVPAAILARMLGIHINVAIAWQHASNGDWTAYAADISRRNAPGQAKSMITS